MLLDNVEVFKKPYPHCVSNKCLDDDLYQKLYYNRPAWELIAGDRKGENNVRIDWTALRCLNSEHVADIWKDFISHHVSRSYWLSFVQVMGDMVRLQFPWLESFFDKKLEDFVTAPRYSEKKADIYLDCQIGINTPCTTSNSTVIGMHLDHPSELFGSLLYMRAPDDDNMGGNLIVGDDGIKLTGKRNIEYGVRDNKVIEYKANSFFGFVNSERSVHGVSVRFATDKPRLLVAASMEFDPKRLQLFNPEVLR
jgi:hypothetical protein